MTLLRNADFMAKGKSRTANSILPSLSSSRFPIAWEPQNPHEQLPFLPSAPQVSADLGWYAELTGKRTRPGVAKET